MQSTTVVNAERCMCSREFLSSAEGCRKVQSTIVVNTECCMCSREFLLQLRDVEGAEHHCCQRRALYVFT